MADSKLSPKRASDRKPAPADELDPIIRSLKIALAAVSVAASALRHQNADQDADIALLLQRAAADRIGGDIERLEQLSRSSNSPKLPK